jgi:hypothetical protein
MDEEKARFTMTIREAFAAYRAKPTKKQWTAVLEAAGPDPAYRVDGTSLYWIVSRPYEGRGIGFWGKQVVRARRFNRLQKRFNKTETTLLAHEYDHANAVGELLASTF